MICVGFVKKKYINVRYMLATLHFDVTVTVTVLFGDDE
jgi:hypothetical protein